MDERGHRSDRRHHPCGQGIHTDPNARLEPACGMDILELKDTYPEMTWAGGIDGVDLMERGTPEEVREVVQHHIMESNVLQEGGMIVATSAEINPPVKPENFKAMVDAVGEIGNFSFLT